MKKKKSCTVCFISYKCLNALWKEPFEAIVSLIRIISHTLSTSPFHSPPTSILLQQQKKYIKSFYCFRFQCIAAFSVFIVHAFRYAQLTSRFAKCQNLNMCQTVHLTIVQTLTLELCMKKVNGFEGTNGKLWNLFWCHACDRLLNNHIHIYSVLCAMFTE